MIKSLKLLSISLVSILMVCSCSSGSIKVHVKDTMDDPNYEYVVEVPSGSTLPSLDIPTKVGYTFKYWSFNGKEWDMNTKIDSEIAIHAKFDANVYPIYYVLPENAVNNHRNPTTYTYNTVVTIYEPFNPPQGQKFSHWADEEDNKVTEIPKGTIGSKVLIAVYKNI